MGLTAKAVHSAISQTDVAFTVWKLIFSQQFSWGTAILSVAYTKQSKGKQGRQKQKTTRKPGQKLIFCSIAETFLSRLWHLNGLKRLLAKIFGLVKFKIQFGWKHLEFAY